MRKLESLSKSTEHCTFTFEFAPLLRYSSQFTWYELVVQGWTRKKAPGKTYLDCCLSGPVVSKGEKMVRSYFVRFFFLMTLHFLQLVCLC